MDDNSDSLLIKNDYAPEFLNGQPTELQVIKEFSYLFDYVLNGYSVPFQLRKFLWKIFTLTKSDKTYAISDRVFAEQLGNVCPNYVVKLRKNLRAWFNAEDDNGIRNYSFVSIKENSYDTKTKKQKPTEYSFSLEFTNVLGFLTKQLRQHKKYKENWIIALKETCESEKAGRLTEFGFYDQRKKKRERSADNILGTYLLNFKRISARILEFTRSQGFEAAETKDLLLQLLPTFVEQSYSEMILKESSLQIKPNPNDFQMFMQLAINYVNQREERPEIIYPKAFSRETKAALVGEKNNVIRSDVRQPIIDETGRDANNLPVMDKVLGHTETLQTSERESPKTIMDSARERFLERRKKRE